MTKIKIISNPYIQEISYEIFKEKSGAWVDAGQDAPNGKLREETVKKCFLPFNAKEIIEIIAQEYFIESQGAVEVIFEGTKDEFAEIAKVCGEREFANKIKLCLSSRYLENGKYILSDTKEIFANVKPVIEDVASDEREIIKKLAKVADALDDIVPICVFGNYSSGKSTFINALIGREVLPSGGDPVTAKAFKIQNSNQANVARIRFTHWDEAVELSFDDDGCHIIKGNPDDKMLKEMFEALKEKENANMNGMVLTALEMINIYDKKRRSPVEEASSEKESPATEIGNMIELDIAFLKSGVLGMSDNKFVIFDTPGSNTATNDGHIEVLKEALDGFSNGIPVWVSQYEAIDTMDNESLCNDIMNIEALDKRFTMIVLNKADVSDLQGNGFSKKQINNIKSVKSVQNMYASGIYFVSSIMGLGAKTGGNLSNKHYRKIYKLQYDSFSDKDDENYMELYQYNIMPSPQMKEEVIACSSEEKNTVYANSGLYCIETEMEEFASRFSAYNKCWMVRDLLEKVVEKTTEKIQEKIDTRKKMRDRYLKDLEKKKQDLIQSLHEKSEELENSFSEQSYASVNAYAKNNLDYNYPLDKLEELNNKYTNDNSDKYNLDDKQKNLDIAKSSMAGNIKDDFKDVRLSDLKDSLSEIIDDTKKGLGSIREYKKDLELTQKSALSRTADEVLAEVVKTYKVNMADAAKKINHIAFNYWENNSRLLRDELSGIVTESDALTDRQKKNLSELIFNYKSITYDDKANAIFVKPKFLQGHLLGLDLFKYEKLNTHKLAREYNRIVEKNVETISSEVDKNYHNNYLKWQDDLIKKIEDNIVDFNPELQVISDTIDRETKEIDRLETSRHDIEQSLKEINDLISFKNFE